MIDVSIIIINYNGEDLLKECLSSIYQKTKDLTYEVIVVDNASNDGNIDDVVRSFPEVKLIRNKTNLGFAAANNVGLSHANSKYVLFLNNDTLLIDNVIKKTFDFAEQISNQVFASCQLLNSDRTKQETVVEFPSVWNGLTENFFLYKIFPNSKIFNKYYQNNIELNNPIEVDVIRGAFMLCSTQAVKKLSGFDERFFFYSEETDLCYRFKKNGGQIYFLPQLSIIHYGGATTDKNLWFKFKNQTIGKIQYYQKHFNGIKFPTILLIHWTGLFIRGIIYSFTGILTIRKRLVFKGYYFLRQLTVYPKNRF